MTPSPPLIHSLSHILTPPLTFSQSTSGSKQSHQTSHLPGKRWCSAPPALELPLPGLSSPAAQVGESSKLSILSDKRHCPYRPYSTPPSPQAQFEHTQLEIDSPYLYSASDASSNTEPSRSQSSSSRTHQNGLPAHSDHSSSTSTPHPLPASGTTHPKQLEIPPKTSSTHQSPRPKKKKQRSYVKQRTQRNIDVIDATFAVCKGSAKAGATRFEMIPI